MKLNYKSKLKLYPNNAEQRKQEIKLHNDL